MRSLSARSATIVTPPPPARRPDALPYKGHWQGLPFNSYFHAWGQPTASAALDATLRLFTDGEANQRAMIAAQKAAEEKRIHDAGVARWEDAVWRKDLIAMGQSYWYAGAEGEKIYLSARKKAEKDAEESRQQAAQWATEQATAAATRTTYYNSTYSSQSYSSPPANPSQASYDMANYSRQLDASLASSVGRKAWEPWCGSR